MNTPPLSFPDAANLVVVVTLKGGHQAVIVFTGENSPPLYHCIIGTFVQLGTEEQIRAALEQLQRDEEVAEEVRLEELQALFPRGHWEKQSVPVPKTPMKRAHTVEKWIWVNT
ncbi:hypothetical protein [Caballeronia sordidicola]|uniref:hypothetical protein n=1 Tax=Caballeronia sordidicola TaxID=196367 RepID=UPI000AAE15C8|nr:hypothetical protein [Caballeronia sordidicola]